MSRKATELYLLKLFNNGSFTVFAWTPILAKKGYATMTPAQAEPYLKLARGRKNNIKYVKDKSFISKIKNITEVTGKTGRKLADKIAAEEEGLSTERIINDAVQTDLPDQVIDSGEVRELCISQDVIQLKEMKYLKSLQHKSTLESHMLEKYQCEIPSGRLDNMKAMANSMLTDLAKDNRLYLIDGQVTTK